MKTRFVPGLAGLLALSIIFGLIGCLPFPLGDPEKSTVDPKLGGFWATDEGEDKEVAAMFPFDQHTYALEYAKFKKQDDKWQPQGPPQVFKAWLTDVKGQRFITLENLQQRLSVSTEQKAYPVMRLTVEKDGLQVRPVSADFEPMKKVTSSAEVEALISKELDNPDLYGGSEGMKFHRLDPDKDKEIVQLIASN